MERWRRADEESVLWNWEEYCERLTIIESKKKHQYGFVDLDQFHLRVCAEESSRVMQSAVWSSRGVPTSTEGGHLCERRVRGSMAGRSDGWGEGGGVIALRISSGPLLVFNGDGQGDGRDRAGVSVDFYTFASDTVICRANSEHAEENLEVEEHWREKEGKVEGGIRNQCVGRRGVT